MKTFNLEKAMNEAEELKNLSPLLTPIQKRKMLENSKKEYENYINSNKTTKQKDKEMNYKLGKTLADVFNFNEQERNKYLNLIIKNKDAEEKDIKFLNKLFNVSITTNLKQMDAEKELYEDIRKKYNFVKAYNKIKNADINHDRFMHSYPKLHKKIQNDFNKTLEQQSNKNKTSQKEMER